MRRRAFVGTLVAALSGCSGFELPGRPLEEPGDASSPTGTPGSPTAPPPTATRTEEPTPTPAETTPRTATAAPATESPTETPSQIPNPTVGRLVADARANLAAAVEAYAGFAGEGAGITGVTAATTEFTRSGVANEVLDARSALDRAEELSGTEKPPIVDRLRAVADIVYGLAIVQEGLVSTYRRLREPVDRRLEGTRRLMDRIRLVSFDDRRRESGAELEELTGSVALEHLAVTGALDRDVVEEKLDQFNAELDAFAGFRDRLASVNGSIEAFARGRERFNAAEYDVAELYFRRAGEELGSVRSELQAMAVPAGLSGIRDDLVALVDRMATRSGELADRASERA